MRTRTLLALAALLLMASAVTATGCKSSAPSLAEDAAETALTDAGYSDFKLDETKSAGSEDSESHQMIAKMRLNAAGMSTELDEYDRVYLVEVDLASGEEITLVVVNQDGKQTALMPESSEE